MSSAVACVAWTPVRSEPSHRSELVSQWLCGERLHVLERQADWLRCRGPDGYVGWSSLGGLLELSDTEADAWSARATGYSLGTRILPIAHGPGSTAEAPVPNRLPWGARVQLCEGGELELPGGVRAQAAHPAQVVPETALSALCPPEGSSVVRAARRWLGAPYLWGGRTRSGVDCSGFVQAVFAVHGVPLPRDSAEQVEVGVQLEAAGGCSAHSSPGVPTGDRALSGLESGDLLFFAPEGEGITHVAIASGGETSGLVIHAVSSRGCVAEDDLTAEATMPRQLGSSLVAHTRPLLTDGRGQPNSEDGPLRMV